MKIRPVEAELFHAEGRTDMTKLNVRFCNSASVHNNLLLHFIYQSVTFDGWTHHKYEGWNFNSGNYLFTIDTK